MKHREAERRLHVLECVVLPRRGGGSHRKWPNPTTGGASALPDHGGRELKIGTIRTTLRQLGIEWSRFIEA
jgi:predicted RNA binding protein YcfA (HicA-like mRNA interferase family)